MDGWRVWGMLAGMSGAIAVLVASWVTHGLASAVSQEELALALTRVQSATQQHLLHTLALLGVALACRIQSSVLLHIAGGLFALGIVLFSFGIYVLHLWWPMLGSGGLRYVIPVGGMAFIFGWIALALAALLTRRHEC